MLFIIGKGLRALVAAGLIGMTAGAWADQVELDNGDRISGTVVSKSGDKLILKTPYADQVTIPWSQVRRIRTDTPLLLRLDDGRELRGTLSGGADGLTLTGADGSRETLAGPAAIGEIGPIPAEGPPPLEWRGHAGLAAQAARGNTDTDLLALDTRVVGERKKVQRFTLGAAFNNEKSSGTTIKQQYLLGGKYDHFFSDRWFVYASADFEKDKFKDLDLRSIFSLGSGYQFYDSDDLRLSLEAGLGYTDEQFIVSDDNRYAGLQWGLNWEQALFDRRLRFFHRHQGNQGLDASDNLLIRAQTGLRMPLAGGIQASAEYDLIWDRSPADNAESTDAIYKLSLGYDW